MLRVPEIDYDKVDRLRGLEDGIVTTAKTDEESKKLPRAPRHAPLRRGGRERPDGKEIDDREGVPKPSTRCRRITAAPCAGGRAPTCDGSRCAASASRERALLGELPGVTKSSQKPDEHLRSDRGHAHACPERVPRPSHRGRRAGVAHQREIARILKDEGFIADVHEEQDGPTAVLRLTLKYVDGKVPVVSGLKRISKPGLRVYARKTDIRAVLGGLGIVIVSTSKGIMTGQQARQAQLGGEVLAYVW